MNPLIAVISVILHLKRTCPVCKRDQVVPASKRIRTVPCKFCGADVPPRKGLWCLTSTRVLAKLFISSVKMCQTSRSTRPGMSSLTPVGKMSAINTPLRKSVCKVRFLTTSRFSQSSHIRRRSRPPFCFYLRSNTIQIWSTPKVALSAKYT